ncbi:MAG: hypothetical protein AB7K08_11655 [Microbacteriaceae bacterium]
MSADAASDAGSVTPEPTAEGGGEWVPEFAGQRPPFLPGNEAAVTHGARSPRKVEAVARKISDELADRFPIALDYPETLNALARVEGVARMLFADLVTNSAYSRKGEFRAALIARWNSAENTAAKLRASLGMTPASEAQVARDRAVAAAATVDVLGELAKRGAATRAITTDPDREDT